MRRSVSARRRCASCRSRTTRPTSSARRPSRGADAGLSSDREQAGVQAYEGQSEFKYIPVDQEVELNLGAADTVIVEPTLMDFRTDNFQFDNAGNISGWDETRAWKVEVKNTRPVPAKVEIKRHFPVPRWELEKQGEFGDYEKVNLDTVKFTLTLDPRIKKEFQYTVTTHHGTRAQ